MHGDMEMFMYTWNTRAAPHAMSWRYEGVKVLNAKGSLQVCRRE